MPPMEPLRLVPLSGPEVVIDKDQFLVGREAGCDLVVNDSSVSRRHAVVERRPEGWLLLDQRSANGTFLDGQRVIQAFIRSGQELRLGNVVFRVTELGGDVAPPQPGSPPAPTEPPPPASPPATPHEPAATPVPSTAQAEAASLLGVWPGASPEEVLHRYQKLQDGLLGRLNHAPTPALKRMYQKDLQDLRAACEALLPGSTGAHGS
jgi:hypothetical protein